MASYTTPALVRQLLDPAGEQGAGSAASLTDELLQSSADRATAEVNARLSGRYSVPFIVVPDLVQTIATDLAAYDATLSFYGSTDITDQDPVVRRYAESKQLLMDIAMGRADLYPGESGGQSPAVSGGRPKVNNPYQGSLFCLGDFSLGSDTGGWWPSR